MDSYIGLHSVSTRQVRKSKYDIEQELLQISSFLKNEEQLKLSDRFAGPGATRQMFLDRQDSLSKQYAEILDHELGFPQLKQTKIVPQWQTAYELR